MVICLKANLPDAPGALIRMLTPISENMGNILSVIHNHDSPDMQKIPVMVRFTLPQEIMQAKLEQIEQALKALDVQIIEITQIVAMEKIIALISGHVFETDFVDTYKKINTTGAKIERLEARFTGSDAISNVKFEIRCNKEQIDKTMEELRRICSEKKLSLIADR